MAKQTDVRVIHTRQLIKEAFLDLLERISFSKITVEKLTQKACISRNTFYLHYTDKFDLLNQLEKEMLDGLEKIITDVPFENVKVSGFSDSKVVIVLQVAIHYISENNRFFKLMMSEHGDPAFLQKLGETIKGVVKSKMMDVQTIIPQRYIVAIIIGIQTSIIKEWLHGGMHETPDEIVGMLVTAFRDVPKNLFSQSKV